MAPDWVLAQSQPAWQEHYGSRFDDYRLPQSKEARETLATEVGADGLALLTAIYATDAPAWLREIPAVQILRRIWIQNYTWTAQCTLRWRTNDELPPASQFISSPHDPDARYSQKRTTSWVGYKVYLTESCDADLPHLITNVETTPATTADDAVTPIIHTALLQRDLLPSVHLADTGFIDAELIVESNQRYQLDLLGPVRPDNHRQAREGRGFAAQDFVIDWERQQATYPPNAPVSVGHRPSINRRTR